VGGFGNAETMRRTNGRVNVAAMHAAQSVGVPRFVFISAHHYVLPSFLQKGYFEGKFAAEKALQESFGKQGVQIRPTFIFVSPSAALRRSLCHVVD
jgi:nucleoside-diphosphate-sugar epimerase